MSDATDPQEKGRPGAAPVGELSLKEAAEILGGVHRSRIKYWQQKGWLPRPLTRAAVEAARQLQVTGHL
jgi:hypothetical protein